MSNYCQFQVEMSHLGLGIKHVYIEVGGYLEKNLLVFRCEVYTF